MLIHEDMNPYKNCKPEKASSSISYDKKASDSELLQDALLQMSQLLQSLGRFPKKLYKMNIYSKKLQIRHLHRSWFF